MFTSLFTLSLVGAAFGSLQIVPGATWTAKNTGDHVQAHGGSITKYNGLYYWSMCATLVQAHGADVLFSVGENKTGPDVGVDLSLGTLEY